MNLNDTLTHFVPFQRINDARAAILAADDIVAREDHHAAVKKEVDWGNHIGAQLQAAQLENHRLKTALDMTAVERIRRVLSLIDDVTGGAGGKHDDTCHHRHAACLARKVHEALSQDVTP